MRKDKEKQKQRAKGRKSTILLLFMFFVGLCVMLYPSLSNFWNQRTQSQAIVDYEKILENLPQKDMSALFAAADKYNAELLNEDFPLLTFERLQGYDEALNLTGNGMMGYINIDRINVELPIYHGTDSSVLDIAVGHLEGSSLPVGGNSTHCLLSAHRGLPTAKLFTDLDKLEIGDIFTISVLDRVLTYEVDSIRIVEPRETNLLNVVRGEDYCTLITCTPYGINTHRLLVRGKRIENIEQKTIYITTDAYQIDVLIVTPCVAAPMLLALMIYMMIEDRKNAKRIKAKAALEKSRDEQLQNREE